MPPTWLTIKHLTPHRIQIHQIIFNIVKLYNQKTFWTSSQHITSSTLGLFQILKRILDILLEPLSFYRVGDLPPSQIEHRPHSCSKLPETQVSNSTARIANKSSIISLDGDSIPGSFCLLNQCFSSSTALSTAQLA